MDSEEREPVGVGRTDGPERSSPEGARSVGSPSPADSPPPELTAEEIAEAWWSCKARAERDLALARGELRRVREEVYLSPDDRMEQEHTVLRRIQQLENSLIALGEVEESAHAARLVTTHKE